MQQFNQRMRSSVCFNEGTKDIGIANLRVTKVKMHSQAIGKVWIKQAQQHTRGRQNQMAIEIKTKAQDGKDNSFIIYIQQKQQKPGKYHTAMYKFGTLQQIGECQFQVLPLCYSEQQFNQSQSVNKLKPTPNKKLLQNSPGTTMKKIPVPHLTVPYHQLIQERDKHAASSQKMKFQIKHLSQQNYFLERDVQQKNREIQAILNRIQQCQMDIQKQIRQKQAILDVICGVKTNQGKGSPRSSKRNSRKTQSMHFSCQFQSQIERICSNITQSIQIFNLSMISKYTHLLQNHQALLNQLENCKGYYIQSLEEIKAEKDQQEWEVKEMDKTIIEMQKEIAELAHQNKVKNEQNQKVLEQMAKIKEELNENNYQFSIKQEQYLKRIYLLENGKEMPSTSSSLEFPILQNKVKASKQLNQQTLTKTDLYTLKYHNQNLLQHLRQTQLQLQIQHQQKLNLQQKLQQLMVRIDLIQKRYELEMKFRGESMLNQSIEVDLSEQDRSKSKPEESVKQDKEMWLSFGGKE